MSTVAVRGGGRYRVIRGRFLVPTSSGSVVGDRVRWQMGRRNLAEVATELLSRPRGWRWRRGSVDHSASSSAAGCSAGWSYADTRTCGGAGQEAPICSGVGRFGTSVWLQMEMDLGSEPGSSRFCAIADKVRGDGEELRAKAMIIVRQENAKTTTTFMGLRWQTRPRPRCWNKRG